MRIKFEDGTSEKCAPDDQRQITCAEIIFMPVTPPKRLDRIWADPPTYSKLAVERCSLIVSGHYVMTAQGPKRVARVEQ
jgi:hypothetical protein